MDLKAKLIFEFCCSHKEHVSLAFSCNQSALNFLVQKLLEKPGSLKSARKLFVRSKGTDLPFLHQSRF